MSYLVSDEEPTIPLRLTVRVVIALAGVASLIATLIVLPYVLLVLSFDAAPSARWGWMHVPVMALPVLLLSVTGAAILASCRSKVMPLWFVAGLLVADLIILAAMGLVP